MNATQPLTGLHRVPEWPRLAATVTHDGTGTLTINGVSRACAAESVAALRTGMIAAPWRSARSYDARSVST